MRKLLVFGRSGQLAQALAKACAGGDFAAEFIGREALDLAKSDGIEAAIAARSPDLVINAAAYTAVDKAESEPQLAIALNHYAPATMARASTRSGAAFLHVSTDYVFDGVKTGAYSEMDTRAPTNIYGTSKAAGEDAVMAAGGRMVIVRTSWVYSAGGANFVTTMLRLAGARDEVGVVGDQIGRPTYSRDLADACLTLGGFAIDGANIGPVHFAGSGTPASWADFAEEIFELARPRRLPHAKVRALTTAEYPTPARRPVNSVLDISRYTQLTGAPPRPWREALTLCMDEIAASQPS